jgi:hypothetical protein
MRQVKTSSSRTYDLDPISGDLFPALKASSLARGPIFLFSKALLADEFECLLCAGWLAPVLASQHPLLIGAPCLP